ncbi:DEAD/DEAH box helicase [Baekduia sp. Peel2402]|uniref:DEAD/DEAH box helicase n=1 Tax=Baekduia sp. Peel2402 TaxID=3458296 RepID=UPI00403E70D5
MNEGGPALEGFDALHPSLQHHIVATLGWRSLRPLQERAIAPLLAGDHSVLSAPTAGGKTESVLFPLLSRMVGERWGGMSVLYVCPLRALLNDLEPRVQRLCSFVGRRAELWHGDTPQAARAAILRDPPDILLTTPESLEAMALSVRIDHRSLLGGVRSVVVDEVHAFAGDDRGWHLLAVLARLDELLEAPAQRVGLTATVGNPESLLDWLIDDPASQRSSSTIVVPAAQDGQSIDLEIDWVGTVENAARVIAALHQGEKRLVFADSRARVEELAAALRALDVTVFVSHSSLAAAERRDAEAAFREARDCVIVATSTLELGIDVGDLDRVIQIGAPATVASLLQRLGRAGRRPGTHRNCLFLATRDSELLQALALCERVFAGWVEPLVGPPLPVQLVAQQLLATALSAGRVDRSAWPHALGRVFDAAGLSPTDVAAVVDYAVDQEMVRDEGGLLSIGPAGEETFGGRHFLEVMSLFLSAPLLSVRHGRHELGTVDPSALGRHGRGEPTVLLLGGRPWAVRELSWGQRAVWVEPSKERGRTRWSGEGRALSFALCQAQRRVLAGEAEAVELLLTRRGRDRLTELRQEIGLIPPQGTWITQDGDAEQAWWWTFAGGRANRNVAATLESSGYRTAAVDDLRIGVDRTWPADAAARRSLADAPAPSIDESRRQAVKFSELIPGELIARMLATRDADVEAVNWLSQAPLTRIGG